MELLIQFMMGVSLAACAGLRAWLPLLVVGLLARTGQIDLGQSFSFLASNPALIIFGLATILELLADKIIALDNILDAIGTIMRPVAGALIATGLISFDMDPTLSTIIGIITGGGAALGLHTGKAAIRAKSTALGIFPCYAMAGLPPYIFVKGTKKERKNTLADFWSFLYNTVTAIISV